jgi:hypothetical protein
MEPIKEIRPPFERPPCDGLGNPNFLGLGRHAVSVPRQVDHAPLLFFGLQLKAFRRHITSVGALISLLGLITSPLTQQMIDYPLRTVAEVNGSATVSIARVFNWTGTIDTDLAQILPGINNIYTNPIQPLTANCSSSNCTFPAYSSLAVCSQVKDLSSLLDVSVIPDSTSDQWSVPDLRCATDGATAWNASLPK